MVKNFRMSYSLPTVSSHDSHILIKCERCDILKRLDQPIKNLISFEEQKPLLSPEDYKYIKILENKYEAIEEESTMTLDIGHPYDLFEKYDNDEPNDSNFKKRSQHSIQVDELQVLFLNDRDHVSSSENMCSIHDLLTNSKILFVPSEKASHNSVCEDRTKFLRNREQNLYYKCIAKFIDKPYLTESDDSFSCQIQEINRQLTDLGQCLFSTVCGFGFGFLGIELFVEKVNVGVSLIIGFIFASIIAAVEFYCIIFHKKVK